MNEDFLDMLRALLDEGARFLVAGAHALALHGIPRATRDLDVLIDREPANSERVWCALVVFGAPLKSLGLSVDDLVAPGIVVQIRVAPRRIDLLTDLTGLEFADAWTDRDVHSVEGSQVPFLGRRSLIQNKRATGA